MLFNSFEFFVFFGAFCALFFSVPKHQKPFLLLLASYIFYAGWRPSFLILLLITTVVDYVCALSIDTLKSSARRRAVLIFSLSVNLGLLCTYKYLDFAIANVMGFAELVTGEKLPHYALDLILPVGISFYTFQSIGYTLDVYYRRTHAERSLLFYAIYVAFFPQLVAGPIERAAHMIRQYKAIAGVTPQRLSSGFWLIGWGLFKKMCIADLASPLVNGVYADPTAYNGTYTLIATLLFALQIYCDFSGYSDIAIGCARIMGIDLMINFRQPYFSSSLTEFWRRWHISLSTWFRDYVYQPLGGNRVTKSKAMRNTMVVFALSGIWHGASWTFLIWGLLHGTALVIERLFGLGPTKESAKVQALPVRMFRIAITFAIVIVAWVFFRAKTMHDALYVIGSWAHLDRIQYGTFKALGLPSVEILVLLAHVMVLFIVDGLIVSKPASAMAIWRKPAVAMTGAVVLFYDIALFGVFGRVDFVYFQF